MMKIRFAALAAVVFLMLPMFVNAQDYERKYNILVERVESYTESMDILSNVLPYFNSALMAKAENFHDNCFSVDGHISNSTNAHYIYARGKETKIKFFKAKKKTL